MMYQVETEIQKATTISQIRNCFPIIHQLRPHLTEDLFLEKVQRQMENGYQLAYLEDNISIRTVSGFRFMELLAWGKVLYVDDLITDNNCRSKGYASKMIDWLIEEAKKKDCDQIHLDSGFQRHDAHRFYLNKKFKLYCHHFMLDVRDQKL